MHVRRVFSRFGNFLRFVAQDLRRKHPCKPSSLSGKDADPDIPILKQAKAEYAKLQ